MSEPIHIASKDLPCFLETLNEFFLAAEKLSSAKKRKLTQEVAADILTPLCGWLTAYPGRWEMQMYETFRDSNENIFTLLNHFAPLVFKPIAMQKTILKELLEETLALMEKHFEFPQIPGTDTKITHTTLLLASLLADAEKIDDNFIQQLENCKDMQDAEKLLSLALLKPVLFSDDFDDSRGILQIAKKYLLSAKNFTPDFKNSHVSTSYPFPFISLCQHSGAGKTRLIVELGRKIFPTVYISFKGKKSPDNVLSHLRRLSCSYLPSNKEKGEKIMRASAFIIAIFNHVYEKLQQSSFKDDMDDESKFSILKDIIDPLLPGWDYDLCHSIWASIIKNATENEETLLDDWRRRKYLNGPNQFPLIVIAIDGAGEFVTDYARNASSAFTNLRQAAYEILILAPPKLPFIFLMADSATKITEFGPSKEFDPSAIDLTPCGELYPPFYSIPTHDIKAKDYLGKAKDAFALDQNGKPNWLDFINKRESQPKNMGMNNLGCPLWSSFKPTEDLSMLNQFARNKLTEPIASIACRIPFTISPCSTLAKDLISTSMARLDLLSEDCSLAYVSYPSDPNLASGASLFSRDQGNLVLKSLYKHIRNNDVAVDNVGQLVGQIILLMTVDKGQSELNPFASISIGTFLRLLFLHLSHANFSETQLAYGKLSFNHFIEFGGGEVDRKKLCLALIRGAALMGKCSQEAADIFIPVCLPDGNLSCIFVRTINNKESILSRQADVIFEEMHAYAQKLIGSAQAVRILFNFNQGRDSHSASSKVDDKGVKILCQGLHPHMHSQWKTEGDSINHLKNVLKLSQGLSFLAEQEFCPILKEHFDFNENWDYPFESALDS